jgi:hypothetical protein
MRLRAIVLLAALWAVQNLTVTSVLLPPAAAATPSQTQAPLLFSSESAAQVHCPRDIVVWLNIPSGVYHLKGERWYAKTKHGAFVCKREADAAGDRETRNGQ